MKKIRSAMVFISFFVFGCGAILLNFFVFPFIKNNKFLCSDIIHNAWKFFVNFMITLGLFKLKIKKLSKIENKIIVATHPSFIDIVILIALIPRSTCFVKNEVDLEELKSESKKMLDLGFNVIIFPSGIRHRKNEFPKIKKGASLIALNANKNIVPIRFFSNNDFMFINQPFYEVGEKRVTFEIEQMPEINVQDFISASEIVSKKKITQQIEKSLYNS